MATFDGKPMLPSRPHIDHLRKQAKARLAGLRAIQPDARLADAQRMLAREYGFPSWSLLHAEVLRRASTPLASHVTPRRRRGGPFRPQIREQADAALVQATHAESHASFFLSGGGTNIGIMFIVVAIFLALWVLTSSLPGASAQGSIFSPAALELLLEEKNQRLAEQRLPRTAVPFIPTQFDRYAGIYQVDRYQFIALSRKVDRYFLAPVGQENQAQELFPESPTKFFLKTAPMQIGFMPDAQGDVGELILHTKGLELHAPRVNAAAAQAAAAELAARIKANTPSPGTADALRNFIAAFQHGQPDYDALADGEVAQLYERAAEYTARFKAWGALKSLAFAGVMANGADKYLAVYDHGRAEIAVDPLAPDGRTAGIRLGKITP